MSAVAYSLLNFVMLGLCWSTIALSAVIFLGRGSKSFLYIGIYAIVQLLLELKTHGAETGSPLLIWMNAFFSSTLLIKALLYGISGFLLLLIIFSIVDLQVKITHLIAPSCLFVWLVCFTSVQNNSMVTYWLFLLPYEIYTFVLVFIGFRRLRRLPEQAYLKRMRYVFFAVMLLTVLTQVEDTIVCFAVGFTSIFHYGVAKERNFCECMIQIILFSNAIYTAGQILLDVFSTEPAEIEAQPKQSKNLKYNLFAFSIGLSRREMEVLPLLLENMSIQEIAQKLYISQGTVKSHAHNIYQKANVNDRIGLIQKALAFAQEEG